MDEASPIVFITMAVATPWGRYCTRCSAWSSAFYATLSPLMPAPPCRSLIQISPHLRLPVLWNPTFQHEWVLWLLPS